MVTTLGERIEPSGSPLAVPTAEAWRAMTPEERLDFQVRILDALSDPQSLMSEGRAHKRAKSRALDALHLGEVLGPDDLIAHLQGRMANLETKAHEARGE